MNTTQRLWQYALLYKKTLLIGLILLAIAVAADLAGPFVAKKIIDDHIAKSVTNGLEFKPIAVLLAEIGRAHV